MKLMLILSTKVEVATGSAIIDKSLELRDVDEDEGEIANDTKADIDIYILQGQRPKRETPTKSKAKGNYKNHYRSQSKVVAPRLVLCYVAKLSCCNKEQHDFQCLVIVSMISRK